MNGTMPLAKILTLVSGGIICIGSAICVFGLVQLGLAIKDGTTGSGMQLSGSIAMIIGGAIVTVAGVWFALIDISWAN